MRFVLALIPLLIVAPAMAQQVEVLDYATFVGSRHGATVASHPGASFPLLPDVACYGWRMELVGVGPSVILRDVMTLPAAPKIWGTDGSDAKGAVPSTPLQVAPDRKSSTIEGPRPVKDGWVQDGWCVADGDPAGTYTMEVYLGTRLLHTFVLTAEPAALKPPAPGAPPR